MKLSFARKIKMTLYGIAVEPSVWIILWPKLGRRFTFFEKVRFLTISFFKTLHDVWFGRDWVV